MQGQSLVVSMLDISNTEISAVFTIKTAIISTAYPGATPVEVEQEVTDIETAVQQLSQVKEVRSISRAGLSIIFVDIKDSYMNEDIPQVWDELRRKASDYSDQMFGPENRRTD